MGNQICNHKTFYSIRSLALAGIIFFLAFGMTQLAHANLEQSAILLVSPEYAPYIYEESGEIKGIVVDILQTAFSRIGKNVRFLIVPWTRALQMARRGEADGIAILTRTSERQKYLDFGTQPLLFNDETLFVKKDSSASFNGDLSSMSDYSFGVVTNYSYGERFDDAVAKGVIHKIDRVDDVTLNAKKLNYGRYDVMICSRDVGWFAIRKIGGEDMIKELSPPVGRYPVFTAFTKARDMSSLKDSFDSVMKSMTTEGQLSFPRNFVFQR